MNAKQVRFSTEEEIIRAIDDAQSRAATMLASASDMEAQIKANQLTLDACCAITQDGMRSRREIEEAEWSARNLEIEIKKSRRKIEKLQKRATNLIEKRCKRLGKALASFRTIPMECITGKDLSVVLE